MQLECAKERSLEKKLNNDEFCEVFSKADIVFFSECWLDGTDNFTAHGFDFCPPVKRQLCKGGGILCIKSWMKGHISLERVHAHSIVWIKIDGSLFDFDNNVDV